MEENEKNIETVYMHGSKDGIKIISMISISSRLACDLASKQAKDKFSNIAKNIKLKITHNTMPKEGGGFVSVFTLTVPNSTTMRIAQWSDAATVVDSLHKSYLSYVMTPVIIGNMIADLKPLEPQFDEKAKSSSESKTA